MTPITNNQERQPLPVNTQYPPSPGGARARGRVVAGKLAGRRVKLAGGYLELPDSPAGRALAALLLALTGRPAPGGRLELAPDVLAALEDLHRLIGRVVGAAAEQNEPDPQIFNALIYSGVMPNVAVELARDEWLLDDPDRAVRWGYEANNRSGYDMINNPGGLIVSMIRQRKDPPYLDEFMIADLWNKIDAWRTKNPRQ